MASTGVQQEMNGFLMRNSLTMACSPAHFPASSGVSSPEDGEILDPDDEEDDEDGSPTSG